jgi:regulator of sigma E protease
MGRPIPLARIGGFVEGYPAESSGLKKGDLVIAVDDRRVRSWEDLTQSLSQAQDSDVELELRRQNQIERVRVPLRVEPVQFIFGKTHLLPRLGILPDPEAHEVERLSLGPALTEAFVTELHLTGMTYKALFYLVTGRLSLRTVSGPIGIMTMTGTAAKMGTVYVLHLMAVLGISLAVINLLPIPALDGGHFIFLLVEVIRGRGVSIEFQERFTQVGFVLLMALMVLVLYNDLINLQVIDRVKAVFTQ